MLGPSVLNNIPVSFKLSYIRKQLFFEFPYNCFVKGFESVTVDIVLYFPFINVFMHFQFPFHTVCQPVISSKVKGVVHEVAQKYHTVSLSCRNIFSPCIRQFTVKAISTFVTSMNMASFSSAGSLSLPIVLISKFQYV